jgi:hypothetical protein
MRTSLGKLCLVFLVFGCTRAPQELAAVKWKSQRTIDQLRDPAQDAPVCGEDTFTVENVRREVRRLEAAKDDVNARLSGTWKHLNLRDLPIPQALFLNRLGLEFGDLNRPAETNVSHCRDVPCVINAVYRSADGIEGWVIYGWWLRMGNVISFKNQVHNQLGAPGTYHGATYPLVDWLFTRQELYGYWRLLRMLPAEFSMLTALREIQRLPGTATFETRPANICGLAYTVGYVVMQNACLGFGVNRDTGSFYEKVIHELSHQIDFHRGRAARRTYFSHEDPWKSEGAWSVKEILNTATNRYQIAWTPSLDPSRFVNRYALTNPQEHFAETISYFRVDGQTTAEKVPESTYALVRSSLYEGADYHREGLNAQFMAIARLRSTPKVILMVMNCLEVPTAPEGTLPLPAEDFPVTLTDELRACLGHQQQVIAAAALDSVRREHVDGCYRLGRDDRRAKFEASFRDWLKQETRDTLHHALESRDYFIRLSAYEEQLFRELRPVNLFVNCHSQRPAEECYARGVTGYIQTMISTDVENADGMREELEKRYLRTHSFDSARAETQRLYQDFVMSKHALLSATVKAHWQNCSEAIGSESEAPVNGLFSIAHHWMPPAQFNCLNRGLQGKVQEITTALLSSASDESISERSLVAGIVLTEFLSELGQLFRLSRVAEETAIQVVLQRNGGLRSFLASDFNWLVQDAGSQQEKCELTAIAHVNHGWRYHQVSDLRVKVRPICAELITSPDLLAWLRSHPRVHEQMVLNDYVRRIEVESERRARMCLTLHPSDSYFNRLAVRSRRGECYERDWESFERLAWSESIKLARFPLAADAAERARLRGGRRHREIKNRLMGGLLPNFFRN